MISNDFVGMTWNDFNTNRPHIFVVVVFGITFIHTIAAYRVYIYQKMLQINPTGFETSYESLTSNKDPLF